jgi:hypothetical protein
VADIQVRAAAYAAEPCLSRVHVPACACAYTAKALVYPMWVPSRLATISIS